MGHILLRSKIVPDRGELVEYFWLEPISRFRLMNGSEFHNIAWFHCAVFVSYLSSFVIALQGQSPMLW